MSEIVKIVSIHSDSKGYFDRQCPNPKCEYKFKVNINDWKNKVSNEAVYCPQCGYCGKADQWYTHEQVHDLEKRAKSFALNYAQQEMRKIFSKMARNSKSITFKPNRIPPINNAPIFSTEEWELDITCEKCSTRYSVIGSAYFCPCCGYNSVEHVFSDSLNIIKKMMDSAEYLKETMAQKYGKDDAQSAYNNLIENALKDAVSAFQSFALDSYKKLPNCETVRSNDFQIIEKGDNLFKVATGKSYRDFLTEEEIIEMNILFQQRHILEHNKGFIDDRYIQKSKDNTYKIGQRIIVRKANVVKLINIIEKLCDGIRTILSESRGQK